MEVLRWCSAVCLWCHSIPGALSDELHQTQVTSICSSFLDMIYGVISMLNLDSMFLWGSWGRGSKGSSVKTELKHSAMTCFVLLPLCQFLTIRFLQVWNFCFIFGFWFDKIPNRLRIWQWMFLKSGNMLSDHTFYAESNCGGTFPRFLDLFYTCLFEQFLSFVGKTSDLASRFTLFLVVFFWIVRFVTFPHPVLLIDVCSSFFFFFFFLRGDNNTSLL